MYSIPHLEFICNLPVPVMPTTSYVLFFSLASGSCLRRSFTIDKSGDFFGWSYHPRSGMIQSASYGTLFNMHRSLPSPDIDLTANKGSIPSQPQPVSMGPASFFGTWLPIGNQSISGAQVDDLCEHYSVEFRKILSCHSGWSEQAYTSSTTATGRFKGVIIRRCSTGRRFIGSICPANSKQPICKAIKCIE